MKKRTGRTGRTTRKEPRCKVCNTQVWSTYASFCKKHSRLFTYLSRLAKYKTLGEKGIIELIRFNKYVINRRSKT